MISIRTFCLGLFIFFTQISDAATLVLLDVGEGQAVLLKDGADAILVDTGHAGAATTVLQALAKYEVKSLKAIVLTHLHADHASGWFRLHEAFPDAPVFYTGHIVTPLELDDISRWVYEAIIEEPNYREIQLGDSITVGRCIANVIWPKDPYGPDLNANALVLEVTCGGAKALLMADANRDVEQELLRNGAINDQIGLLVVGHHGAADATSIALLAKIEPEQSVISVNADNLRGYPSPKVINNLKAIGSNVLRTDVHGDLCFHAEPGGAWRTCK